MRRSPPFLPRPSALPRSIGLLLLCLLPLGVGWMVEVDRGSATLFGIEGPACPVGATLGEHACPGCGLTRATALSVQGRFPEALAVHPAGPAVAALALLGALVATRRLVRGGWPGRDRPSRAFARLAPPVLGFAVGLGWLARVLTA